MPQPQSQHAMRAGRQAGHHHDVIMRGDNVEVIAVRLFTREVSTVVA